MQAVARLALRSDLIGRFVCCIILSFYFSVIMIFTYLSEQVVYSPVNLNINVGLYNFQILCLFRWDLSFLPCSIGHYENIRLEVLGRCPRALWASTQREGKGEETPRVALQPPIAYSYELSVNPPEADSWAT